MLLFLYCLLPVAATIIGDAVIYTQGQAFLGCELHWTLNGADASEKFAYDALTPSRQKRHIHGVWVTPESQSLLGHDTWFVRDYVVTPADYQDAVTHCKSLESVMERASKVNQYFSEGYQMDPDTSPLAYSTSPASVKFHPMYSAAQVWKAKRSETLYATKRGLQKLKDDPQVANYDVMKQNEMKEL